MKEVLAYLILFPIYEILSLSILQKHEFLHIKHSSCYSEVFLLLMVDLIDLFDLIDLIDLTDLIDLIDLTELEEELKKKRRKEVFEMVV